MKLKLLKYFIPVFIVFISINGVFAQSLSPERVTKVKDCTVKITIEGSNATGTGFFVNSNGTLLTCWHVIEPAIVRDPQTHTITDIKKIFIHLSSKEILEVGISKIFFNKSYVQAIAYDYCMLSPLNKQHSIFPYLKIGNFNNTPEGQEVYTCGYPLGINQQFISKGILSTKYVDSSNSVVRNGQLTKMPRSQALLDLTLNKGNSGGAIIKIGQTVNDDEVIGIADFIINPIGGNAEELIEQLQQNSGSVFISGVDTNNMFANIIQLLNNTSIGVSGCISINHFLSDL